jgi:iron(III) transport system ATP-binding protein
MISIRNLAKRFGQVEAVHGVSMDVPDGAFLVLVGPSGCGKSTILRMLAGLEAPTGGTIAFDGRVVSDGDEGWSIEPAKRHAGLVFQSYALWPHMTVAGNVDWPLKVAGWSKSKRQAHVREVLSLLGIEPLAARYPNEISGGQQQRVAIARALISKPTVLFADEPTGNLDSSTSAEILELLRRSVEEYGQTIVMVTHDARAAAVAHRVLFLADGEIVRELGECTQHEILTVMEEVAAA